MAGFENPIYCQLWMGGVEQYMTEGFIMSAFQQMGENPTSVKVMRDRVTGELCGYCFIHFENDQEAMKVLHEVNGKMIPNSNPPSCFHLNTVTSNCIPMSDRDYSLWVRDLSSEVNEYMLYRTFASRYESVRTAKVVFDGTGKCKRFGFIRFAKEEEQNHCLINMNGFKGLGAKPLKIRSWVPRAQRQYLRTAVMTGGYSSSQDYSQQYEPSYYWHGYVTSNYSLYLGSQPNTFDLNAPVGDLEVTDYNPPLNVEAWNRDLMERDFMMWDALESSKWLPVDTF